MNGDRNSSKTNNSKNGERDRGNVIDVTVRIRPEEGRKSIQFIDTNNVNVFNPTFNAYKCYKYNRIFSESSSQQDVFVYYERVVDELLSGIDVGLIAYGQTGSGKTYTIVGDNYNSKINSKHTSKDGLTLNLLPLLFNRINSFLNNEIKISFIEIYNEEVYDLLSKRKQKIDVYLNEKDILHQIIKSYDEALLTYNYCINQRSTASTILNRDSSRSHLIFKIQVNLTDYDGTHIESNLYLVDLAGSERVCNSYAEGDRLIESQNINKSLSALGDTINSLNLKKSHIPYRNSKLTYYLRKIIHLNSKIYIICTVRPGEDFCQESICTLEFALRLKEIELEDAKVQIQVKPVEIQNKLLKSQVIKLKNENKALLFELNDLSKQLNIVNFHNKEIDKLHQQHILIDNTNDSPDIKEDIENIHDQIRKIGEQIDHLIRENELLRQYQLKYKQMEDSQLYNELKYKEYTDKINDTEGQIKKYQDMCNIKKIQYNELVRNYQNNTNNNIINNRQQAGLSIIEEEEYNDNIVEQRSSNLHINRSILPSDKNSHIDIKPRKIKAIKHRINNDRINKSKNISAYSCPPIKIRKPPTIKPRKTNKSSRKARNPHLNNNIKKIINCGFNKNRRKQLKSTLKRKPRLKKPNPGNIYYFVPTQADGRRFVSKDALPANNINRTQSPKTKKNRG